MNEKEESESSCRWVGKIDQLDGTVSESFRGMVRERVGVLGFFSSKRTVLVSTWRIVFCEQFETRDHIWLAVQDKNLIPSTPKLWCCITLYASI